MSEFLTDMLSDFLDSESDPTTTGVASCGSPEPTPDVTDSSVDAEFTYADVEEDATATGAAMGFDTDADGRVDSFAMDGDGDGTADAMASDTDGDAQIDTASYDTDGDGVLDTALTDIDGDGVADAAMHDGAVLVDLDDDGALETAMVDTDGDGMAEVISLASVGQDPIDAEISIMSAGAVIDPSTGGLTEDGTTMLTMDAGANAGSVKNA